MVKQLSLMVIGAVVVATGWPAYAGIDSEELCREKNTKAAGREAFDLLKAFGKNTKKENALRLASDISKAQSKFTRAFTKAASKWPSPLCGYLAVTADAIEGEIDEAVLRVLNMLNPSPSAAFLDTSGSVLD